MVWLRSMNWDGAAHEPREARGPSEAVAGGMAARDEGHPYGASRSLRSNGIFVMSPAHLLGSDVESTRDFTRATALRQYG
jgi:hypothetical protein